MKNLSVKKKFAALTAALIFTIAGVGALGFQNVARLHEAVEDLGHTQTPAVFHMVNADMMHDGLRALVYRSLFVSKSADNKERDEIWKDTERMGKEFSEHLEAIGALKIEDELKKQIEDVKPTILEYSAMAKKVVQLALEQKLEEAQSMIPKFNEVFSDLEEKMGALGEKIEMNSTGHADKAGAYAAMAHKMNLIIVLMGIGAGIVCGILIIRSVSKAFDAIISTLRMEAEKVFASSHHIRESAIQLSERATEQAAALQETASSVEELNSMVKKSSENAARSRDAANASQRDANQGQSAVSEMTAAMEDINQSNQSVLTQVMEGNRQISEIVKVITEIGNKTKVINDIVFQTKLLSFNASVEAARAGEHGKGFAVVAEEVGNLAQMSGNAAKEISEMLESSIARVETIVKNTKQKVEAEVNQGKNTVEKGLRVSKQCGDILGTIVTGSTNVNGMIDEIASATEQQAIGINEITKAMNQLDEITHANSSASEQGAHSAEELSSQSSELKHAVGRLELLINGYISENSSDIKSHNHNLETDSGRPQGLQATGNSLRIRTSSVTRGASVFGSSKGKSTDQAA